MQPLPETGNKLRSSVRNTILWNSLNTQNASNVQLCILLHAVAGVHMYKVGRLGKLINNHSYGIKLAGSQR
jgi:hypothetical protein